jgi:hypothetical protein
MAMHIALLIPEYFLWHYSTALKLCLNIATNVVWFTYHFFSIPVLARTLFEPWHGIHNESYRQIFKPNALSEKFLVKIVMRFFGFVIRVPVIILGLVFCGVVAVLGFAVFIVWLVLPFAATTLFVKGIQLII